MKRKMTAITHHIALVGTSTGILLFAGPKQEALGLIGGVEIQVTYSKDLTASSAVAIAGRIGYETDSLIGVGPVDLSLSDSSTGISSASASIPATFSYISGGPLLDGHIGNVSTYAQLSSRGIQSYASLSGGTTSHTGDTLDLGAGSFFDLYNFQLKQGGFTIQEIDRFVTGQGTASIHLNAPINTTIQNIAVNIPFLYIIGLANGDDGQGSEFSEMVVDPTTIIDLNIGGQHLSGGLILNEAGETSTYGDLTYDNQTQTLSFDTSSFINLDVSGESTVELNSVSRLPGDFNNDEIVDDTDIDLLYGQIAASYTPTDIFDIYDLNIDGLVNAGTSSDVEVLVETILLSKVGDADLDRFIGIDDLNTVLGNWNQTGVGYAGGDLDGDNFVGIDDMNLVLANWNWGTPPSVTANIPEPATLALLTMGVTLVTRQRG